MTLKTRKIGLGIMGLADLLYEMEIPYNSEEGRKFMERLMEFINYHSKIESIALSRERGPFPYYEKSFYKDGKLPFEGFYDRDSWTQDWSKVSEDIKKYGIRNGYTIVVAPTGSISMIAGTSSGIEPQFSLVFEKQVTVGTFFYVDAVFEEKMRELGLYDDMLLKEVSLNRGSIQNIPYIPESIKRIFVTALDIDPIDHIKALASLQRWVDSSISKTTNLPETASVDDVKRLYLTAHKLGIKDVTIYRYGSISEQVLITGGSGENNVPKFNPHLELRIKEASAPTADRKMSACPICGGTIAYQEGCSTCLNCGWSVCS
jgi:ribonucleoside-diphosphate reductase alpha chain